MPASIIEVGSSKQFCLSKTGLSIQTEVTHVNTKQTSEAVLDQEYLPVRAKILEIAASLDRIQRAAGDVADAPQLKQLQVAIQSLLEDEPGRAKRVQLLFSRTYDQRWRETFKIAAR